MRSIILIFSILLLVSCGKGALSESDKDPIGADPNFRPILLEINDNVIQDITFPTLDPNFDDFYEVDFQIKNEGTVAGDVVYVSSGINFRVSTQDPKCDGSGLLGPGETCVITIRFSHLYQSDGQKTGTITGWCDGEVYNFYPASGEVLTSI